MQTVNVDIAIVGAGGVAANAPEGFGVGKGNGTRGQEGGSDMAFEAWQQIFVRTLV